MSGVAVPMDFEWQIEPERDDRPPVTKRQVRRRRWWLLLLPILAILLGWGAMSWLKRETAQKVDMVTADVLAAHALTLEAMAGEDEELLRSQLDYRESSSTWLTAQKELIGRRFERQPFGLALTSESAGASGKPTVALAPDLATATITFTYAYQPVLSPLQEEQPATPVHLQHVALYRRHEEDGRWLLTEPDEAFWGPMQTYYGYWITVTYPTRDASLVEPWASQVDANVDGFCRYTSEAHCITQLNLTVALSTDPTIWRSFIILPDSPFFRTPSYPSMGSASFALPAPTLFGRPADEEAHQLLFEAYSNLVLLEAMRQIKEAGVPLSIATDFANSAWRPWPLLEATEAGAPPIPFSPAVDLLCYGTGVGMGLRQYDVASDGWRAYLDRHRFVDARPATDGAGLLLQERLFYEERYEDVIRRWHDGEMHVVLELAEQSGGHTWRLGSQSPDGRYLQLALYNRQNHEHRYELVDLAQCNGGDCAQHHQPVPGIVNWSPDGEHMLLAISDQSPEFYRGYVQLGNHNGTEFTDMGEGYEPFWLDDETFGYHTAETLVIARVADPTQHVTVGTLSLLEQMPASHRENVEQMSIRSLRPDSPDDGFYLLAVPINEHETTTTPLVKQYLFRVLLEDGSATSAPQVDLTFIKTLESAGIFFPAVDISPDGQWLSMMQRGPEGLTLKVYRLQQDGIAASPSITRTYPPPLKDVPLGDQMFIRLDEPFFPSILWSPDGSWLLVEYDGVLQFLSLQHDYEKVYVPPEIGCRVVGWAE